MRLRDLIDSARRALVDDAGIPGDEAAFDAELLLRHVLGWDRATALARRGEAAAPGVADAYDRLVRRRMAREPVAYIRGVQEFYGRDFTVGPGVLIPRPETELLVEEGLRALGGVERPRVLDIGTGSGCLAVTLALERPDAEVIATDVSTEALVVARENARRLGAERRVAFVHAAGTGGRAGLFHLVMSNPPYVRDGEAPALTPEVRLHEPATALFGGPDGLDVVRAIAPEVHAVLGPGGTFVLEIGAGQSSGAQAIVRGAGFSDVDVRDDLQRIPRVLVAVP